jgi:hypothetical protein
VVADEGGGGAPCAGAEELAPETVAAAAERAPSGRSRIVGAETGDCAAGRGAVISTVRGGDPVGAAEATAGTPDDAVPAGGARP